MYSKILETANWIKSKMTTKPETAIILGTGLGDLASEIDKITELPYKDIPNFPVSTVEGHTGCLIEGKLGGKDILAMEGRFHYYEGYSMKEVTFPIRVMHELGIKTLFLSNAAGGTNPSFRIGDLGYITDMKSASDDQLAVMHGVKVLIINGLRHRPHHSHQTIEQACRIARWIGPQPTYLIHMCHDIGLFDYEESWLPEGIHLAYDGLSFEI